MGALNAGELMSCHDLIIQLKTLKTEEIRADKPSYFEFVIQAKYGNELNQAIERFLGEPVKRAGQNPGREAKGAAAAQGGVRRDQVLYQGSGPLADTCVMIWPWASGELMTVKVFQNARSR